jgi:hypothetical protein
MFGFTGVASGARTIAKVCSLSPSPSSLILLVFGVVLGAVVI